MVLNKKHFKNNNVSVQETNDSSIVSKASMAQFGYFEDPFLQYFIKKVQRRSPLIHRGYYIRAISIDYVLKTFLLNVSQEVSSQIISLGAGFDSSFFRLKWKHLLVNCRYYEVDFPEVVNHKHILINNANVLKNLIEDMACVNNCIVSKDYFILPCDFTDLPKLKMMLEQNNIDFSIPTLIFSECVLSYVDYKASEELMKWIQLQFKNSQLSIYEQVYPHDAFGQIMVKHFSKLQSPLKRIDVLDTITKHKDALIYAGFDVAIGFDMNFFYENYVKEKLSLSNLDVFDEYEEWHLKCSHYALVSSFQGSCLNFATSTFPKTQIICDNLESNNCVAPIERLSLLSVLFKRFGHACVKISSDIVLITGGFGVDFDNGHKKLSSAFVVRNNGADFNFIKTDIKLMFHTMVLLDDGSIFVYGGRLSPVKPCCSYGLYKLENDTLKPIQIFSNCSCSSENSNPKCRWRHSAVNLKGNIYIFGGICSNGNTFNDLVCFNSKTYQWKKEILKKDLVPRHSHSMEIWKQKLLLYGGLNHENKTLNTLNVLHIQDDESEVYIDEIQFVPQLPARYSHTSHVVDDLLVIVGGVDPSEHYQLPIILIYLSKKVWQPLMLPISSPEYPLMLHNHCSILTSDNKVIVIGGGGNCFSFGTHFNEHLSIIDLSQKFL
ncbi:tRNA wybutosine-synthesizing protein 4 isoform X1 [Hydra vulgaris]|uniref:tRNA wybutosine-synthesizing protein 4 isoform X1 n=1 Tax=Hydra vulgaris TaxID=6087 RepID=UPI0032EA8C4F